MAWKIEGDYFENCSCNVLCQCIFDSYPDEGYCDAGIAWHIEHGDIDRMPLDGLNVVAVVRAPFKGPGASDMALYVDLHSSSTQAEGLSKFFSGRAGGHLTWVAPLIGKVLEVKQVPVEYTLQEKVRSVSVPRILETEVDPVDGGNVRQGP